MIESAPLYLAILLCAAGLFPLLQRRLRWRLFDVLPPIVLTYLAVMALAVGGAFAPDAGIVAMQATLVKQLLPMLLFLLMATCDLRAILALGPRVLAVFACALASILVALVVVFVAFRAWLPADGALVFAALSATWVGGTANLLAVKQSIGLADSSLSPALLTDAVCYSVWVVVLFSLGPFAARFNRRVGIDGDAIAAPPRIEVAAAEALDTGAVLVWLAVALGVAAAVQTLAAQLPIGAYATATTWSVLLATLAGLVVARLPLVRGAPGPAPIAAALLALLVAVLASQSNFAGLASAPLMILCGFLVLALHAGLLLLAARAFRFDLRLCAIASLAQIGGVATAPVLAASYAPALVPVAVLMAMLGYLLGTGVGLMMAQLLGSLAAAGGGA